MAQLRFLVSLITKNNDYQMEQASAARTVAQSLGVAVDVVFGESDSIVQSSQILKYVQAPEGHRPAGIIVQPVGGTALPHVAKAAIKAGIGWAVVNRTAEYVAELRATTKLPVFSLSTDHQAVGELQARQISVLLPTGGRVLYIQGPSEHFATKDRMGALNHSLNPGVKLVVLRAQWTEDSARKSVESWLALTSGRKASIDLVAAQNDAMAVGARKALLNAADQAQRDLWQSLAYIGVDGVSSAGQAWVRAGTLRATIIAPATAGEAVAMMVKALKSGRPITERSFLVPKSFPPIDTLLGSSGIYA